VDSCSRSQTNADLTGEHTLLRALCDLSELGVDVFSYEEELLRCRAVLKE
jgi:hypothetical protein